MKNTIDRIHDGNIRRKDLQKSPNRKSITIKTDFLSLPLNGIN